MVTGVIAVGSASANNIADPNGNLPGDCLDDMFTVCMADNRDHWININLDPFMTDALWDTLNASLNTTDINIHETSTPHGTTDAYFFGNWDGPYGNIFGEAYCIDASGTASSKACQHFHVRMLYQNIEDKGFYDWTNPAYEARRHIACHESGHTVGLLHGENADPPTGNLAAYLDCMKAYSPNPAYFPDIWLGAAHNGAHINSSSHYNQ